MSEKDDATKTRGGGGKKRVVEVDETEKDGTIAKYSRIAKKISVKGVKNRRLRHSLSKASEEASQSATHAAQVELIHHQEHLGYVEAEGLEKTYRLKQDDLAASVPVAAAMSYYDLKLTQLGPYSINYTRNGRHLLLGGRKGHLASIDWRERRIVCEVQVGETIRDVCYLHNEMMMAAAQKEHVYIYDHQGTELHRMKELKRINVMKFLPYHFLLATAGGRSELSYLDVSVGRIIAHHHTRTGELRVMADNPYNAVLHLGHHNGTVTMWTPNMSKPVVKMLCHRGPLTALAVDTSGQYMVTAGMDTQIKVWDCRQFHPLHSFFSKRPAASLSISQRGLVGLGYGDVCEVWRDALTSSEWKGPYLTHKLKGQLHSLEFCPLEDVLGAGHSSGFSSMIVPGAGEPNFDALEVNPFQTKRQRQESEVISLLEKVPADLITIDPKQLTGLDDADEEILYKEKLEREANAAMRKKKRQRLKQRGRSKPHKLAVRKRLQREAAIKEEKRQEQPRKTQTVVQASKPRTVKHPSVLDRFVQK